VISPGPGRAPLILARLDSPRYGSAWRGRTRHGTAGLPYNAAGLDKSRPGVAGQVTARQGTTRRGGAGLGSPITRLGMARLGSAGLGAVGQGKAPLRVRSVHPTTRRAGWL
jgi:hypothetical protein